MVDMKSVFKMTENAVKSDKVQHGNSGKLT